MVRFNMPRNKKRKFCHECGKEVSVGNITNLCYPCKRKFLFINNLDMNKPVRVINGEIIII